MHVLIANENPLILEELEKILAVKGIENTHIVSDAATLTTLINKNPYDFIIAGSVIDGISSIETLKNRSISTPVIITSKSTKDAYIALKTGVFDYVIEPIKAEEISESIQKVLTRLNEKNGNNYLNFKSTKKRFRVKIGDKMKSINTKDVALIFAEGKLVYVVTYTPSRKYIIEHNMDDLEKNLLDSDSFFRISRKYFVHIDAIEEVRPYLNSRLKILLSIPNDRDLIVSREKVASFKKWLNL
jgi:DNA-binding LytR/AlgR family response regulator